jgi:hypothetical protein
MAVLKKWWGYCPLAHALPMAMGYVIGHGVGVYIILRQSYTELSNLIGQLEGYYQ